MFLNSKRMETRRKFLKTTTALTAGSLILPFAACNTTSESTTETAESTTEMNTSHPIGVQLYTLRDVLPGKIEPTLEALANIGYTEIESFGLSGSHNLGMSPTELKKMLGNLGLTMVSAHVGTGILENGGKEDHSNVPAGALVGSLTENWEAILDATEEVGQPYIVCPYLQSYEYNTADARKATIELLNTSAEDCHKRGIQFCYHNHDFEFLTEVAPGKTFFDQILEETDAEKVKIELDLYWVAKAGFDALTYFKQYPGRFPLFHVKDMDGTEAKHFTEVGNGVIDFERVFAVDEAAGLKHYFVEQDQCPGPPLESLEISFKNLTALLA